MRLSLSLKEIFLLEVAAWLILWLADDYLASLLTLIVAAIVFSVLIIALVSEWIEPTKIPRIWFWVMAVSIAAPVLTGLFYIVLFGEPAFLKN